VNRYGYNRYVIFFQRNFSWILIVFVFFSLVLSAMQVGSSLKELENNYAFLRASYIFVVFSMVRPSLFLHTTPRPSYTRRLRQDADFEQVSVVAVLGVVALIFVGIFMYNMFKAISHASSEQKARRDMAKAKRDKSV
jgi:uncharacterized membrane protein